MYECTLIQKVIASNVAYEESSFTCVLSITSGPGSAIGMLRLFVCVFAQ